MIGNRRPAAQAFFELIDPVEQLASQHGSGEVQPQVSPQPLRSSETRGAARLEHLGLVGSRAGIEQAKLEIATNERDPHSGPPGDARQLERLLPAVSFRYGVRRTGSGSTRAHRLPAVGSNWETAASFSNSSRSSSERRVGTAIWTVA